MTDQGLEQKTYLLRSDASAQRWMYFSGSILLFGVVAVGFIIALRINPTQFGLHSMTTLPALFAVGLLFAGISASRAPRAVSLDETGITIIRANEEQLIEWTKISCASTEQGLMGIRHYLNLYDLNGRKIIALSTDLVGYEELAETVKRRLEEHASPAASAGQYRRLRRVGTLCIAGSFLVFALFGFLSFDTYRNHRNAQRLANDGVPGEGVVIRKFIAPDGRTHRIEYRVTGTNGASAERNVEIAPSLWNGIETNEKVPVVYVPDLPEANRLAFGEISEGMDMSPTMGLVLCIGGALLGLFFLVGGILAFKGIDISFDEKESKFKIRRVSAPRSIG